MRRSASPCAESSSPPNTSVALHGVDDHLLLSVRPPEVKLHRSHHPPPPPEAQLLRNHDLARDGGHGPGRGIAPCLQAPAATTCSPVASVAAMDDVGGPKYYCPKCKKGFICGQALGGHMRTHGNNGDFITDVQAEADDSNFPPSGRDSKRAYSLRSNPSRQKTCRTSSCNSLLEHHRCAPDADNFRRKSYEFESSSVYYEKEEDDEDEEEYGEINENAEVYERGWIKRKRTKRCKVIGEATEEDDLAASCLVMLSSAKADASAAMVEMEDSSVSASKEEEKKAMLDDIIPPSITMVTNETTMSVPGRSGGFECKACKRVFSSHQALGGHRASHKKVKGCFAAKLDSSMAAIPAPSSPIDMAPPDLATTMSATARTDNIIATVIPEDGSLPRFITQRKPQQQPKMHVCTICHRTFSSGQALGGHKRCHWLNSVSSQPPPESALTISSFHHHLMNMQYPLGINLNVPVPVPMPMPVSVDSGDALDHSATALCLQPLHNNNLNNQADKGKHKLDVVDSNADDEAESKVKLAKLSELKDIAGNDGSGWLKMGIGSNPNGGSSEP